MKKEMMIFSEEEIEEIKKSKSLVLLVRFLKERMAHAKTATERMKAMIFYKKLNQITIGQYLAIQKGDAFLKDTKEHERL